MAHDEDEDEYSSQAEAILHAMIKSAEDGGGTLALHDSDCSMEKSRCTCKPLLLSVPPEIPVAL